MLYPISAEAYPTMLRSIGFRPENLILEPGAPAEAKVFDIEDQGVIKVRTTTLNQNNESVQVSVGNLIVLRRPASSG